MYHLVTYEDELCVYLLILIIADQGNRCMLTYFFRGDVQQIQEHLSNTL